MTRASTNAKDIPIKAVKSVEKTVLIKSLQLKSGLTLQNFEMKVWMRGTPNKQCSNVVVVSQGMTCGANPEKWWGHVFNESTYTEFSELCFVSISLFASARCAFHAGNLQNAQLLNAELKPEPFVSQPEGFPLTTMSDSANALEMALAALEIKSCALFVCGSFGGLQFMDFIWQRPNFAKKCLMFAAAPLDGHALVISRVQTAILQNALAICTKKPAPELVEHALAHMRLLGNITYRSQENLVSYFPSRDVAQLGSPLHTYSLSEKFYAEAAEFSTWFNAVSFLRLLQQLESFELPLAGVNPLKNQKQKENFTQFRIFALENDFLMPESACRKQMQLLREAGFECSYDVLNLNNGHESWILDEKICPPIVFEELKKLE